MSSPLLQPLTVLDVSPSGRLSTGTQSLDDVDPAIDVSVVDSVHEAIDRIENSEPGDGVVDAVVCEHSPPQVDGVESVAAVREHDFSLPVIVVPADDARDCTEAALTAGATDVVQASPGVLSPAVLANRIRQFAIAGGSGEETSTPPVTTSALQGERESPGASPPDGALDRLHEASQELRHAGRKDVVADVLVDVTTDVLDAPGVAVFLFDDGDNLLRPAAITEPMADYYGGETVFGPGKPDSITWQVFVSGESMLFDDIRTSGINVNEDTDARSSVFVPFGEHGVLVASTDAVGAYSESSRQMIELLGTTAEATLDRIESTAVLRHRERRLREQDNRLQYLDRITELSRAVDRAVVAAETREDVESGVVECLVDDGDFDFAWIGTADAQTGQLTPRVWDGDGSQYLDEVSLSVDDCDEPSCRTAREWQVTNAPNVAENLDGDGWERDALARDFHSVLSVPMVYDGVLYGVLTAYADRPDAFQDRVTSILRQVGETTAYAINATERKFSMLSSGVTELELEIHDPDDVLNVIAASVGTTIECLKLTPLADGSTKVLFSVADVSAESVLTTSAGLVAVDSVTHVAGDDAHLFSAVVSGEMVGSVIATSGGAPEQILADGRSFVATVNVPDVIDARTFVNRLERRYPDTTLLARRERDESAMTRTGFLNELDAELTDRQMEVLRTAYECGFFRSPRDATGQDVADRLGVSQPTVSHHLRAGQGKLFSLLFGEQ